jgi:hypothetical protein
VVFNVVFTPGLVESDQADSSTKSFEADFLIEKENRDKGNAAFFFVMIRF